MNKKLIYIFSAAFAICLLKALFLIIENKNDNKKDLPRIDYSSSLIVDVKTISFERNGLFINNEEYDAEGISSYSRVYGNNFVSNLNEIKLPFTLRKKEFNDTLTLVKGKVLFFLLVKEEQAWAKRKLD